mgnify:CR=1 FL=1
MRPTRHSRNSALTIATTAVLACAAVGRNDFINRIRNAHSDILKLTEEAMTLSLKGDPQADDDW